MWKSKTVTKTGKKMAHPNNGSLNKNHKKTEPKHPDYRGNANVDGIEYWLSAWVKTGQDGNKFLSLAFREKDEQPGLDAQVSTPSRGNRYDDDIDF